MLRRLPRFDSVLGRRLLGIGVIAGAIVVILLATLRPNPFKESQTVVAEFDRVQGLGRIDRNVRVAGANVGEIGGVSRDGDIVVVELEIEPGIPIHSDAQANLRPHTLFEGSAFVDLHPGSPSASLLEEGEAIPPEQTETYTSLDQATRVFNEDNREHLKEVVGSASRILRDEGVEGLRRTLRGAPGLMRELGPTARALRGPGGDELAGAIEGLSETVAAVGSQEEDLVPFARHANATLGALQVDGGRPLDAALAALPGALEELDAASGPLTALLNRVDTLATELAPAARELAPLLRESRPLLRRSTPIIREATPLLGGLRVVLARTADAAPALRRAILALRPGARLLEESVLPVMNADTRFGVPVYAQLISAFTGGAAVARPFHTPQQNDSAGHMIRAGAYFDPEGTVEGFGLPSCETVALLNPEVAHQLELFGLCNP